MENSNFGNKLIQARQAKGWTQMILAEKSNISLRTIQRIESGHVSPRAYTVKQLSEIVGLDFNELFENPGENNSLKQHSTFIWLKNLLWHFLDLFNLKTKTMKKLTILSPSLLIIFFICTKVFSSTYPSVKNEVILLDDNKTIKKFEKNFVRINDTLYASKKELSNIEYKSFLKRLRIENNMDEYRKCIYDSTLWTKIYNYSFLEPMTVMYHWHPAYDNFPIVNITKEAMTLYCDWVTKKYNNIEKRSFKKVKFRLPTEMEWKTLSSPLPGHNLPWSGDLPYEHKDKGNNYFANIKIWDYKREENNYPFDKGVLTEAIGSYKPNDLGIFDVIGNVSEMTLNGKIKGGSWDNYIKDCGIDKEQNFEVPDPRVGCRLVMEIIER